MLENHREVQRAADAHVSVRHPASQLKTQGRLTLLSLWEPAVARVFKVWIFSKTRLTFLFVVSSLSLLLRTRNNGSVNTSAASVWGIRE